MEWGGPGAKMACVAFSIRGALGLWFAAQGEFPFAECSCQKIVWGRRCDGVSALSGLACSGGRAGAWAQKAFARPILLPHEGEPVGSGFRAPETPSKAAGLREPWQPCPGSPYGARGPGAKWLALLSRSEARWGCGLLPEESFPLQNAAAKRLFGAVGATGPRRCAAELAQGAWLGPVRRRPSRAQSCFPTKENPWGVGFGHRRPPAKQQGPGSRGSPAPVRPMEWRGSWAKTACVAFSIRGALGLWFAARGEFPFAECSCQKIVWGRRCDGASALSSRAGSGGMAGAWAQKASRAQSCFPTKENPWGVGFGHRRPPAKQQGPGSQGSP